MDTRRPMADGRRQALLAAEATGLMNLNPVAKGIPDEEPLPRRRPAILGADTGGFEPGAQGIEIRRFEAEMALEVGARMGIDGGEVEVQAPGIKPDAGAVVHDIRLRDFAEAELATIKGARGGFTAPRHGDVDVGEFH